MVAVSQAIQKSITKACEHGVAASPRMIFPEVPEIPDCKIHHSAAVAFTTPQKMGRVHLLDSYLKRIIGLDVEIVDFNFNALRLKSLVNAACFW